jgi:hypothetical protein
MGEIKSTLDIIMEKTKGLTLTEDEKKALRNKEVEGKVKGLLLKYIDGQMDLENLKAGITAIEEKDPGMAREIIIKDCLGRIDPESDNRLIFEILEHVARADAASFQKPLSKFHRDLDQEKRIRELKLRKKIVEKGISGSAVLPNIHADQEWIHYVEDAKEKFQEEIKALMQK